MGTTSQTFFYSTTEQDFTASGEVDIRKLLETAPGSNATTVCTHPNAAGTTSITLDPYTNSSTQSDIRANAGWAVNRGGTDGMQATTAAKRAIPAGVWSFDISAALPIAGTATGTLTLTVSAAVYRVSSAGARTLLFTTGDSNSIQSTGLATAAGVLTCSSTSQPVIVLDQDETIHAGLLSKLVQVAGLLGATVSGVATFTVGTATQPVTLPSPGVRTQYASSGSVAGVGMVAAQNYVRLASKAVTGVGVVTVQRYIRLAAKSVVGVGLVSLLKYVRRAPDLVAGVGAVSLLKYVRRSPDLVAGVGVVAAQIYVRLAAKAVTGLGVAAFSRRLDAFRSSAVTAVGVAAAQRALVAVRAFAVVAVGVVSVAVKISQAILNRLAGGATTIVRKVLNIFDDSP